MIEAALNLCSGGPAPWGLNCCSWSVSKNNPFSSSSSQQMLIFVCLQKEAITESEARTHLLLINPHQITPWLTAAKRDSCVGRKWSEKVDRELYWMSQRGQVMVSPGLLLHFLSPNAALLLLFHCVSSVLWQRSFLHKLDLVKFHSTCALLRCLPSVSQCSNNSFLLFESSRPLSGCFSSCFKGGYLKSSET